MRKPAIAFVNALERALFFGLCAIWILALAFYLWQLVAFN